MSVRQIRQAVLLGALCLALAAEIIDRIAVSVGNQAITSSDIDREIRVTSFLNRSTPDFSPANRRATADRMVEQKLILRELENSRYPVPPESEIQPGLDEFIKKNFATPEEYKAALAQGGLTQQDLKNELLWQRRLLTFIDVRFRAGVQVTDEEIQNYFTKTVEPAARAAHPGEQVTLDEYRERIEKTLTGEKVDKQMSDWLADARTRQPVVYHDEAFK